METLRRRLHVARHPLGPFEYKSRNPILIERGGLVNGCGHHSVVEGPDGNLWAFYTILARINHKWERRIAMDPVGFDTDGNIFIAGPTETPQFAPGARPNPAIDNDCGLLPVSVNKLISACSFAPGHEPAYANDNCIRTFWEAGDTAMPQWISIDLKRLFEISAARTIFSDSKLNYANGILPGPYRYRIEVSADSENWSVVVDQSQNKTDKQIAYDVWPPTDARHVRLTILAAPPGLQIGLWEFTVFGLAVG